MPQHPQYLAKPADNLDKMDKMLGAMLDYGLIHEDRLTELDSLMNELHGAADSMDSPRDCFDGVADKEQFVQDYRNAIASIIYSDSYGAVTAEDIIGLRDPEYYKMHTSADTAS